jgi:hypothetical protein
MEISRRRNIEGPISTLNMHRCSSLALSVTINQRTPNQLTERLPPAKVREVNTNPVTLKPLSFPTLPEKQQSLQGIQGIKSIQC